MKNKSIIFLIFIIFFLFCAFLCKKVINFKQIGFSELTKTEGRIHTLVVFVHGTIFPLLSYSPLKSLKIAALKKENSTRSHYQNYLDSFRMNSLYKKQAIGPKGLFKIKSNIENKNISQETKIITSLYKTVYHQENPTQNEKISIYTFGWDGRLDHKNRAKSARQLYDALQKRISKIKSKNSNVKIKTILLTHSHGGNVALNLATTENSLKQNLIIDELVLLGTPIQKETQKFVQSTVFKSVYNLYSTGDMIQTSDTIFSTKGFQSARRFYPPNLLSKLKQAEIIVENKHPRHNELWLFGNCTIYRNHFPLYPFPVVVFIPIITKLLEEAAYINKVKQNPFLIKITKAKDSLNFTVSSKESKRKKEKNLTSKSFSKISDFKNLLVKNSKPHKSKGYLNFQRL